jgi:hypothetical protein
MPPQRAGWGRFWLGVLAGGCAVVLLEAVAVLIVGALVGSAINAALHQSGQGAPGLPGVSLPSLTLPSSLPHLNPRSDPCTPQPCVAHDGVTVLVGGVNRGEGGASGTHVVRLNVTFVGTAGTHTVTPSEVALQDSGGNVVLPSVPAGCAPPAAPQQLQAGQRLGPFPACYTVSGAASAPLTLAWVNPDDFSVVETRLP